MMKTNRSFARTFVRSTRGANMVEYIMLVGLVALICIGAYTSFGDKVKQLIGEQKDTVGGIYTGKDK